MSLKIRILALFLILNSVAFSQLDSISNISFPINKDIYDTIVLKGVPLSKEEINTYYNQIMALKKSKDLQTIRYQEMSYCGGVLSGYYRGHNLVLMIAETSIEFSKKMNISLIKEGKPVKIIQNQTIFKDGLFDTIIYQEKIDLILTDPPFLTINKQTVSGKKYDEKINLLNRCYNIRLEEIKNNAKTENKHE